MARLFVAVWPPQDVAELLAALPRPEVRGVRWTTPDQWHVTLRFLGEAEPDAARAALATLDAAGCEAVLGPGVSRLGRGVLAVAVNGLGDVTAAVVEATAGIGRPPESRPFRGHITLARLKDGARPRLRADLHARWPVGSVTLVQSRLRSEGATYEIVDDVPLRPAKPVRPVDDRRPAP
jgi:2'-5' RNA ligase